VLDTSVFSAFMAGAAMLEARLAELRVGEVLVPQPVIAEIAAGLERLPRSARERSLRRAFERVSGLFVRSAWTDEVSFAYGRIKGRLQSRGTPIDDFDIAIAAHALVEGAAVATDNVRHFERVPGLQVENWLREH
jgi:tRNA(fMet)-specific endonuclease VapC